MDESTLVTLVLVSLALSAAVASFLLSPSLAQKNHGSDMKISQLHVYPVKGLRGCKLDRARLGPFGILGDRTFCLQKVNRKDGEITYETMFIGYHLQMALFVSSIHWGERGNDEVEVVWKGRGTKFDVAKDISTPDSIRFPLQPSTQGLSSLEVNLHTSKTKAYDMGDDLSTWFTDRLGLEVRLVHIGDGSRPVLGSLAPNSPAGLRRARFIQRLKGLLPFLALPAERLAFNDIAHYLVVTEESNDQVTSRLDDGFKMDVTKFRPNIVVKGAPAAYVEDFWDELTFDGGIQMPLTANCYRCQSITVDYETGAAATDDRGMAWKKLNKDRRVDKGAKYSPVFGRYGYCFGTATGKTLHVGQGVRVTHINANRTVFDWPHLTTFGVSKKK